MLLSRRATKTVFLLLLGCGVGCGADEQTIDRAPRRALDGGAQDVAPARPDSGAERPAPPPAQPPGWADDLKLPEPEDINPDPRVVEINLEAKIAPIELRPGQKTPCWTYNGTLPGPLIRIKAGDRLVLNFTNNLPADTSIHWHGLRVPVSQDGVPGHSQPPVKKNGGKFQYSFIVPDPGLFWFHPHMDSAAQQGDGMYGTILVEDPQEPKGLGDELVLQLSDISIDDAGNLRPHDSGGSVATLFGREGDVLLVNGKVRPALKVRAGLRQRWRVVNSARSRYFQLAIEGQTFVRIGSDGGLIPASVSVERPVLAPGERADLLIVPSGAPGSTVPLRWVPYDRGYGSTFNRPEVPIMDVQIATDPPAPTPPMPTVGRAIAPLDISKATPVSITLTRNDIGTQFALGINGKPMDRADMFHAKIGETQVWTIENTIEFAHPFHLHGFFFQVLDADGHPIPEWKDTTDLPANKPGARTNEKIRIAVRFDDRPGMWMFHCHILDHADAGMGAMLDVSP